jgi:hypothetical protein
MIFPPFLRTPILLLFYSYYVGLTIYYWVPATRERLPNIS